MCNKNKTKVTTNMPIGNRQVSVELVISCICRTQDHARKRRSNKGNG